ncbi:hypothetical protein ACI3KS_10220 [Microbacterium sp. ZW T5_45]|uniref:hypothetical protein n=1 Tax=Microbacterium sp. ZW T5_45 TaxID=3378080 RepID=UPI0038531D2B
MLWIGITISLVAAAIIAFSGGAAGPLWSGATLALFALSALLVAVRRPFGGGRPRLVDTNELLNGRRLAPDTRAHLIPERRVGLTMTALSIVWALVLAGGTVVAVTIGASGRPQAYLGAAVLAVLSVLFGYAAVRGIRAGAHDGARGRRTAGLAIGRDGVTILRPEMTVHLPWSSVRAVEADITDQRRGIRRMPLIRLRIDPTGAVSAGFDRVPATITVQAAQLRAHPQVVWSSLRTFHRTPSARAILGTDEGQTLLDAWSAELSPR